MKIVEISSCLRFEAAHYLPLMPEGHKCRRLHGHNYTIEVVLKGPIRDGIVYDYGLLDELVAKLVVSVLDHRCLNEIDGLKNPTGENIAIWALERLTAESDLPIHAVTVWETPQYRATVYST